MTTPEPPEPAAFGSLFAPPPPPVFAVPLL
jgi:hypothetical protein